MSSKEVTKPNDGKKSIISSSIFNHKNSKEKSPTLKKVSFFNPEPNNSKNQNNRYLAETKHINEEDTDDYNSNLSSDSYDEDRERQLEIVNEKFQNLFKSKEKMYGNIIKEITAEKKLFFKKSIMSFNILVLKIKCLLKILKEKFVESLTTKDFYEVDTYIHKIKKDFKNLYTFINEESKFEYELVTQVYAKFLHLMGIIYTKREEYTTSFSYVSLGVNILKVFFVRQGVANQIETYQIYAKLIILLINKLLSDNNVSQALLYISLLTRICEIASTLVSQNKAHIKYEFKFNKYQSYGFLYMGFCYELSTKVPNNFKTALKAYKEAYYFMNKSPYKATIFAELSSVITLERKGLYLAQILFEKISEKLTIEALEKQKEFELKEKLKKQKLEEARNEEKKYRLKLIASGITPENPNLYKIQEKLYSEILTPSNQVLMDKLDDELISYVYKNITNEKDEGKEELKKENKDKKEKKEKEENEISYKLPSMDVMKNLCHYKMYHNLMSNDYKEFLLHNKNLLFNSPQKEKNSLDRIQKFLNRKMEIDSYKNNNNNTEIRMKNNKEISNLILKTDIDTNNSSESNKITNKLTKSSNNFNNKLNTENNKNNNDEQNILLNSNKNNINKINLYKTYREQKHSYVISKEKDPIQKGREKNKEKEHINKRCITYSNFTNSFLTTTKNNIPRRPVSAIKKFKFRTPKDELENRKVDKFIFNKSYFKQLSYFENLINKELFFQRIFLEQREANAKMFLRGYQHEIESMGIIPREEVYNTFLILNDKVTSKNRNYEKEMKLEIEFKNKPRVFGNMFKSVSQKMKEGKKIRSAVGKVLDKYLLAQKKQKAKRNIKFNKKEINRKNEVYIMNLNDNLKQIKSMEKHKTKQIKKIREKYLYGYYLTEEKEKNI